ncbi:acyl-CoA thioesterase [Fundicoccus culcitae]|uniref:Acyl-CoA thioesterase n=1 Tax=Fundicoccus culcitae TaxID=2969821 RepID=A0ABY5PA56_9LACT|nr:thioesterase family protein [Fundicoccus culcitae]UUX35375.1 acyl-CoA thioesterase [Fundicoccus culcitae]
MFYRYIHEVQFYETDAMQIVHHSNYIRWFEEARISFLSELGYSYKKMEDEGLSVPVLAVDCRYKKSLRFGDTAEVRVMIDKFTPMRMNLSYEIYNTATAELTTTGSSEHCFLLSESGRPTSLKRTHPHILKALESALKEDS